MSIIDSASVNGLLSTPLVLPAPVAGALAALFLVMVVMAVRRPLAARRACCFRLCDRGLRAGGDRHPRPPGDERTDG